MTRQSKGRVLIIASLCLASLAVPRSATALEISLTENKGESGSIGFVDIRRVFREFTEARRTRDAFSRRVSEKEAQFSGQESAILRLKAQITKLEQEKSFLRQLPVLEAPKPTPPAPVASTDTAPGESELERLPGMGNPLAETTTAQATGPVEASTPTASTEPSGPQGPGISRAALERQLSEIDNKIQPLAEKLGQAEKALSETKSNVERELLDEEKRETKRLLARIYRTVQDVAQSEGISVVIDKESILFGQDAVDLTDKVLERL